MTQEPIDYKSFRAIYNGAIIDAAIRTLIDLTGKPREIVKAELAIKANQRMLAVPNLEELGEKAIELEKQAYSEYLEMRNNPEKAEQRLEKFFSADSSQEESV